MSIATDADSVIAEVFSDVAELLTGTGLRGHELRERQHFDPLTKDAFERHTGARPISRTLRTPDFPGVGPVDVVLSEPKALVELKWSCLDPDKIFEGVWDAIKLALVGPQHRYDALYIAIGASLAAWANSESADLFATGEIKTTAIWSRPLQPPRAPNRGKSVGEDLVIGGRGNQPLRAPATLAVRHISSTPVSAGYELRVVRLMPAGALGAWPRTEIATGVAPRAGEESSIQLPQRVTQRWIEATAPGLATDAIPLFLRALRTRGWNEHDLTERVRPYLPTH